MLMRRIRSDIESDGHCMRASKDPPGQRCVYIIPGNPDNEIYRLTTFKKYPTHVPVDYMDLAAAGFYYTGYKDRVKCFGCGKTVEDWTLTDNPKSHDWHLTGCEMVTGTVERNIPLVGLLGRRIKANSLPVDRQRLRQDRSVDLVSPSSAVNTTQSSASNNNNTQESNQSQFSQQLPTSPTNNHNNTETNNLQAMFPCHNPANPHMGITESREQTFLDNNNWPGYRIRATPHQIAEAGMFYLGSRDRVKCWYCNGGLQNWETSDDPWFEHAKWFPECEFVLQNKGPEFVENVSEQNPNIQRPQMNNNQQTNPQSSSNTAPQIIDPQQIINERKRKVREEINSSNLVNQAKLMGFSETEIEQAYTRQFEEHDCTFNQFEDLVNSMIANEAPMETSTTENNTQTTTSSTSAAPTNPDEELSRLEKTRNCKSCKTQPANVVLLPCGHLAACQSCSKKLKFCPLCKTKVKEILKTYIS